MIFIHKNDSTVFADQEKFLIFHIKTNYNLTGWKAEFCLCSVKKTIEDISTKNFEVILTAKDTSKLWYGNPCGELRLIDNKGNIKTIANNIPFCVTKDIVENESQTIDLDIPENEEISISVSFEKSSGISNYEELENIPSINGVELIGNKSLDDLGIQEKGNYLTEHQDISYKANDDEVVHLTGAETIDGTKTFIQPLKAQSGDPSGCLVIGADVSKGTVTAGTRKLGRMAFHTKGSTTLNCAFVSTDTQDGGNTASDLNQVEFGGRTMDVTTTSPDVISFTVSKVHNTTTISEKLKVCQFDKNGVHFYTQPNYNGVNLATTVDIPDVSKFITLSDVEAYTYDKTTIDSFVSSSGGSSEATWGSITGTLSDQTDLQDVLDTKLENMTTKASSLAIGKDTTTQATAKYCTVVGVNSKATADYAIAIGEYTTVSSSSGIAIGRGISCKNSAKIAIGGNATANHAIMIGNGTSSGQYAIGIGHGSVQSANYSIGIGYGSVPSGTYGIGIGYNAKATAENAIQLGTGTNSTANTLQVTDYSLLDLSTGKIPIERLPIQTITQADYDSLETKDTNTFYLIEE